jgi:threonine aldolase
MLLHMDGARIANAAASLETNLKSITRDVGVDVLSFGGAKNGMMYGEAVVFFDRSLSKEFKYTRKQGTHLPSKMRFISAQFLALLSDDLWRKNAAHANSMARLLAQELRKISLIEISQKVESNGVFAHLPKNYIAKLQKQSFFYVWNEQTSEVRFMTSFDTTPEDIADFVSLIKKTLR